MARALIFDIDDTLYDQSVPICDACETVTGRPLPDRLLFARTFHQHSNQVFDQVVQGRMKLEDSRVIRFRLAMDALGLPLTDDQARAFQGVYQENLNHLALSPGMEALLDACAASGLKLGILSNGPAEHQLCKYRTLRVDRWIPQEQVLISAQVGFAKPDIRIFRTAMERLGLDPEDEIWMIGDSWRNDIQGAAAAGWHTIWFDRYLVGPKDDTPDFIVHDEKELTQRVTGLI